MPRTLSNSLTVKKAMHRQVVHQPRLASLEQAIRYMIKYKIDEVLIVNELLEAIGVVTKTDLMGAYYADLPINTPLQEVMTLPLFCHMNDPLDLALDTMRTQRIHRLYVWDETPNLAVGVLGYTDIVGLIYSCCSNCDKSILKSKGGSGKTLADQFRNREVMTPGVYAYRVNDSLLKLIEDLAAHAFEALLIRGENDYPVGVVSKTDLIIAYRHGIPLESEAQTIMTQPVQTSDQNDFLANALRKMIFFDLQYLFIFKGSPSNIVGVLSLTDVAQFRSGTCRACASSRIKI